MDVKRDVQIGQLFWACLDPVFGRELGGFKRRPVLVVSINDINRRTRLAVVVLGTTTDLSGFGHAVEVPPSPMNGLKETGYFNCLQIRAIDQGRLLSYIGRVSPDDFAKVQNAIAYCVGLPLSD